MILKIPTFKELLVELKVDSQLIENVAKFSIEDYTLTFAEAVLLYEGTTLGIADCRISAREVELKDLNIYNQCIGAELLELLLMPKISKIIFSRDKIVILGANIYRRGDVIRLKDGKEPKENYCLNIHDTNIDIDIIFRECTFGGGINLQNSHTRNLTFERVKIHKSLNSLNSQWESISGMNLRVIGSIIFTTSHTESHNKAEFALDNNKIRNRELPKAEITNYDTDTEEERDNDQSLSYYSASINLENAFIKDHLELRRIKVNGGVNCASFKANRVIVENCTVQKDCNFQGASVDSLINIENTRLYGNLYCYTLRAYQFFINKSFIQKVLQLTFAKIEHLFACTETELIGGSDDSSTDFGNRYSIEGRGMVAGNIFLREGLIAVNGIDLLRCDVKDGIDFSESLVIGNALDGIAINLTGAKVGSDIKLSPEGVFIGTILIDEAIITGNIIFAKSKFINILDGVYTISAKNTRVGKSIRFSSSNVIKQTQYEKHLSERKSEAEVLEIIPYGSSLQQKVVEAKGKLYHNNNKIAFGFFKTLKSIENDELSKLDLGVEQERYFDNFKKDEIFIEKALTHYNKAIQYLEVVLEKELDRKLSKKELSELILENTIVVGEVFFFGIQVSGQADFSGSLLYAMDNIVEEDLGKNRSYKKVINLRKIDKKKEDFPNALTMKFSRIDGELFLNEGSKKNNLPFRACGEVNLHSSKIGQFFISPNRGIDNNSKWKIIGVKYNYIYSNESYVETSLLEQCGWFYNYNEENSRQPYEELAAAYLRAGDDTKARKVLLRAVPRNIVERFTIRILRGISRLGIPHYRSLIALTLIFISGWLIFSRASHTKAIIPINRIAVVEIKEDSPDGSIFFSPASYSFQNLLPFINSEQKQSFSVTIYSKHNFFPDWIPLYLDSGFAVSTYLSIHAFASVLFLSMFIIGITRIIKRT